MPNLNDKPCGGCTNFDRVSTRSNHGRCAVQSVYPYKEQAGQEFPPGVKRVGPGELAKPVIVTKLQVVSNCTKFRSK